ncbi:hypothetical protein PRIPAC_74234 [Pristionchus pacificus]|uniref:G protein-coupled receptor n=1 Tax=Pristionchus pacificus TaxID=54126 RepID=A0A2A6BZU1_PRIPA|nr:hypothetical protein PRIPAC_74234 [Pristionchus pacificus]|eukprot:PDM71366.1 G protein-coupled receptor [Pristionchus pacificus]
MEAMEDEMSSSCAFAEELYDLYHVQAVQWTCIALSVASLVLIGYTARHYLRKTIFENITEELIIALYVAIAIYSVFLIISQLSQLFYRYTASTKCDAQVPKFWCIFRFSITVIVCSFIVLHIGITFQHLLSSFRFGTRTQQAAARISIVISFIYPTAVGTIAYGHESLEGRTAYCPGMTTSSAMVLRASLYFNFALHILNILASVLLLKYNHHRLRTEQTYDLTLSFHRRQNLYAMQQFLPISTIFAFTFIIFFVSVCFNEVLMSIMSPSWFIFTSVVANVIPYYCLLCPLLFLLLIRRGRFKRVAHVKRLVHRERDPNDIYFAALRDQWK